MTKRATRVVFHGNNALPFRAGIEALLPPGSEVIVLPDVLAPGDRTTYASADVVVGVRYDASLPRFVDLGMFHVPGAGFEGVDMASLPPSVTVCNCYGHEPAIAEYVMGAMLDDCIPFRDADRLLRQGDWTHTSGGVDNMHGELGGKTLGILGFGHIGRLVAERGKAFGMTVHVANRSRVDSGPSVDRSWTLDRLTEFWSSADNIVVCLPLNDETRSIVDHDAFAAMRDDALLVNVARGPVVDEADLFAALSARIIRKAVIDTWYSYPAPGQDRTMPSALPFHTLANVIMTPHMSGWSSSTVSRRQHTIAENVIRHLGGRPCINVIRPAAA